MCVCPPRLAHITAIRIIGRIPYKSVAVAAPIYGRLSCDNSGVSPSLLIYYSSLIKSAAPGGSRAGGSKPSSVCTANNNLVPAARPALHNHGKGLSVAYKVAVILSLRDAGLCISIVCRC